MTNKYHARVPFCFGDTIRDLETRLLFREACGNKIKFTRRGKSFQSPSPNVNNCFTLFSVIIYTGRLVYMLLTLFGIVIATGITILGEMSISVE